jgi:hypothetical protein
MLVRPDEALDWMEFVLHTLQESARGVNPKAPMPLPLMPPWPERIPPPPPPIVPDLCLDHPDELTAGDVSLFARNALAIIKRVRKDYPKQEARQNRLGEQLKQARARVALVSQALHLLDPHGLWFEVEASYDSANPPIVPGQCRPTRDAMLSVSAAGLLEALAQTDRALKAVQDEFGVPPAPAKREVISRKGGKKRARK